MQMSAQTLSLQAWTLYRLSGIDTKEPQSKVRLMQRLIQCSKALPSAKFRQYLHHAYRLHLCLLPCMEHWPNLR